MTTWTDADSRERRRAAWIGPAILAVGIGVRAWVATWPLERLIATFVADDAFYYTEIARHILAGQGSSFDGVIATNGYHPLWMAVCVVLQAIVGTDPETALRALLWASVLTAGTYGWLIWRIAGRDVAPNRPAAACLATLFWALNPYVVGIDMMGVEAPLAMAAVLAAVERAGAWRDEWSPGRAAILGALCGLAFLARTDAGLLGVILGLAILLDQSAASSPDRTTRTMAAFAGAALATVAPWLIWNLASFGTIWQDSGRVLLLRQRGMTPDPWTWGNLKLVTLFGLRDYLCRIAALADTRVALGAVLGGAAVLLAGRLRRCREPGGIPGPLALHAAGIWVFYIYYFQQQKYWYFLPVTTLLALACARVAAIQAGRTASGRAWLIPTAIGLLLIAAFGREAAGFRHDGFHPWQAAYLQVGHDLAADRVLGVGPTDTIGAFNSGIIGAFAHRRVVNLDGVVNPHIMTAMRQGVFFDEPAREGVTVIVDHEGLIRSYGLWSRNAPKPVLVPTARYPGSAMLGGDVLVVQYKPGSVSP